MKLKKTLSLIVSGICLVAATTAFAAQAHCPKCNGTSFTVYYPQVTYGKSHNYWDDKGNKRTCKYWDVYKRETYKCKKCGRDAFWTTETYVTTKGHTCYVMLQH